MNTTISIGFTSVPVAIMSTVTAMREVGGAEPFDQILGLTTFLSSAFSS